MVNKYWRRSQGCVIFHWFSWRYRDSSFRESVLVIWQTVILLHSHIVTESYCYRVILLQSHIKIEIAECSVVLSMIRSGIRVDLNVFELSRFHWFLRDSADSLESSIFGLAFTRSIQNQVCRGLLILAGQCSWNYSNQMPKAPFPFA